MKSSLDIIDIACIMFAVTSTAYWLVSWVAYRAKRRAWRSFGLLDIAEEQEAYAMEAFAEGRVEDAKRWRERAANTRRAARKEAGL